MLVIACSAAGYFVYLCLPHGYRQLEQLESRLELLTLQGVRIEDVRAGTASGCRNQRVPDALSSGFQIWRNVGFDPLEFRWSKR